ncbi:lipoate--protein ligase family protein [Halobacterium noricense]|uniref:lipoate--protein ligase family protein n=1 Tax=Halobacterium noricense TaxID=223182 RepID=UPI001E4103A0|nr:lipoate--protein ligase family protein [Halobacterium noricense]UHH25265.1 lipoate--protein ligase family protein [Halobacterium noricense]
MRVLRGRADSPDADRAATRDLFDSVGETGEPAVRVWAPGHQLAFGRRDTNSDGYEAAREAAREHGFPPIERSVGGRAVAYTETTRAFARVTPVEGVRTGLQERYDAMVADVVDALAAVGVDAHEGEPPESFCPGDHSVSADGKLAGIAQRVTKDAALTSGVLVVDDRDEIADVLSAVYPKLGVPFDPKSVGSVATAGGDTERVRDELESALVGDAEVDVERLS